MTESRHDDLRGEATAVGDDLEVPEADALDQTLSADPDVDLPPTPRPALVDPEVPVADAWEQSLPADVYDDY